jgi:predicted GNAT family acetyltransferase
VEEKGGLVLAALMTPPHKLIVYGRRGDLSRGARRLIGDLIGDGWDVPGVLGPAEAAKAVVGAWSAVTGQCAVLERQQRVHELRELKVGTLAPGRLRLAVAGDIELVTRWRHDFVIGIWGTADWAESERAIRRRVESRDVYLWDDGCPVSMAVKTRPTKRCITVSYVYTPPEERCRGYATACVAELSRTLLAAGWESCALFADVTNAPANRVYRRIGYVPVCDYEEYTFAGRGRRA